MGKLESSYRDPYTVLKEYREATEWLCIRTVGSKQHLDTIKKDEANSLWNRFIKSMGLFEGGPLAHVDTSVKGVEEYLVKLFISDGKDIRTMDKESQAYKITAKIAK